MIEFAAASNYYISLAAIAGQIATVGLVLAFALRSRVASFGSIVDFVGRRGILIAFAASFFASFMTLFYSEFIGFEPCPLCWWQRVFLYPQVILFGMALWKKDAYVAEYSIVFSVFGLFIALYQHAMQIFPGSNLPCPATGPSCSIRVLYEFGYITFPFLAVTIFAFLLVTMLIVRARRA